MRSEMWMPPYVFVLISFKILCLGEASWGGSAQKCPPGPSRSQLHHSSSSSRASWRWSWPGVCLSSRLRLPLRPLAEEPAVALVRGQVWQHGAIHWNQSPKAEDTINAIIMGKTWEATGLTKVSLFFPDSILVQAVRDLKLALCDLA